jgi:hypothetical protein
MRISDVLSTRQDRGVTHTLLQPIHDLYELLLLLPTLHSSASHSKLSSASHSPASHLSCRLLPHTLSGFSPFVSTTTSYTLTQAESTILSYSTLQWCLAVSNGWQSTTRNGAT